MVQMITAAWEEASKVRSFGRGLCYSVYNVTASPSHSTYRRLGNAASQDVIQLRSYVRSNDLLNLSIRLPVTISDSASGDAIAP